MSKTISLAVLDRYMTPEQKAEFMATYKANTKQGLKTWEPTQEDIDLFKKGSLTVELTKERFGLKSTQGVYAKLGKLYLIVNKK